MMTTTTGTWRRRQSSNSCEIAVAFCLPAWHSYGMTEIALIKGQAYTVRSTVCGEVGATFRGRFGSELLFRTADGRDWAVPVAYFVSAVAA